MRIAPKNTVNSATLDAHHPKQDAPPPLQIAHPSSKGVHFLSLRGTVPRPSVPRPTGYTAASQPTGVHCPRFGVHCPSRAFRTEIGVRFALDSGYTAPPEPSDRNRGTFCNQIGIRFQEPAYPKNRHTFGTQIAVYSFWRARSARGIPRVKSVGAYRGVSKLRKFP